VGAYSSEENFIRGDPEGVIDWISGEVEAFEEILSDRGDICAFANTRGGGGGLRQFCRWLVVTKLRLQPRLKLHSP
jgi:hypothetical protein